MVHTRDNIYPILRYDLQHYAKMVPADQFLEFILNAPPEKITNWSRHLTLDKLLDQSTSIMDYLRDYCVATKETDRYAPWSAMANQIISLAPTLIPGLPEFPHLLEFVRNDPVVVGEKGSASRKPDVVVIHESFYVDHPRNQRNNKPTADICWQEIWACAEFKMGSNAPLKEIYQELKARYKDGPVGELPKASDDVLYHIFYSEDVV